jgi:hypothetical protein
LQAQEGILARLGAAWAFWCMGGAAGHSRII